MTRPRLFTVGALAWAVSGALHAQDRFTQSDWGGAGLLQTPTARMEEEGQISLGANYTSPYARYNVSMQPFTWFEGTFRYASLNNIRYGREDFSGDQHIKDKSIDFKVRLFNETRLFPALAFGMRDLGGTGLFSSEYLVANKRFGDFDLSFGLATGYLGNRGDFSNPLRLIDDRFGTRPPPNSALTQAGRFGNSAFRGPVGVFGGVSWNSPIDNLLVKLELDGNDYKSEPDPWRNGQSDQGQSSPINLGLLYSYSPSVQFSAGIERGNTLMVGISITGNLKSTRSVAASFVRPTPKRAGSATPSANRDPDAGGSAWPEIAERLQTEAGLKVTAISARGAELIVRGEQQRYFYGAQGVGRAARVLDDAAPEGIDWFTFAHDRVDMPIAETSVSRQTFADYVDRRIDLATLARNVEIAPPASQQREVLYQAPFDRFQAGIGPGYKHVMGGPDGFILYQLSADASATYWFGRHTWVSGIVSADVLNNFDKFRYNPPSRMPRVRTYQREFLTTSSVTVPNLQLTTAHHLGGDLYGMTYAGYLESMYGGVGGEVLYRPFGERWAFGVDLNHVRQRNFDQRAGFRDYEQTTGHATAYVTLGDAQRVQANISVGRYLAGDIGGTVNIARRFDNGVTMGAWATKTNVSSATFGEGSFDKGIYFSVPMDFLLPRPTRARASIIWQPLVRDGGARLVRRYSLYSLTAERDGDFFLDNLDWIDR